MIIGDGIDVGCSEHRKLGQRPGRRTFILMTSDASRHVVVTRSRGSNEADFARPRLAKSDGEIALAAAGAADQSGQAATHTHQ